MLKRPFMRLGGFVIHGNNRQTLTRCLESLKATCDEVVAIDSESTDGSATLVRAAGVRHLVRPWRGYGAARLAARRALESCDYLFFLDSDEWLEPRAIDGLHAWRGSRPALPLYTLRRRNWVELEGRRFRFFTDTRARLVRLDAARWEESMVVHEALPRLPSAATGLFIEHSYATSIRERGDKEHRYALLWALRFASSTRRVKAPSLQWWGHMARHLLVQGALFRGGGAALSLSRASAVYHSAKYGYLKLLREGAFPELLAAYEAGDYESVYRHVREWKPASPA